MSAKPDMTENRYPAIRLYCTSSPETPRATFDVSRPLTIIGSGPGSDLVLAPGQVDGAHAALVRLGGGVFVSDLGAPGGTRVNESFVRWARLEDGDELKIGPNSYAVEIEASEDAIITSVRRFFLRNDQSIGSIGSEDPVLLIGSDASCDIVLGEGSIAPRHAMVVWTCEGPMVRDLRGRRSVRVKDRWVNESRISAGDSIGVGTYEMAFEIETSATGESYGGASRSASGWRLSDLPSDPDQIVAGRVPAGFFGNRDASPDGDVGHTELSEDEAARELVRSMEAMGEADDTAWASDGANDEGLDDSDVLELLEEVEEIDERNASPEMFRGENVSPRRASSSRKEFHVKGENSREDRTSGVRANESLRADRLVGEKNGDLNSISPDLRQRVIAAQQALDERARKLREELDAERGRLRTCQEQLQTQARRLLDAAQATRAQADEPASDAAEDPMRTVEAAMEAVKRTASGTHRMTEAATHPATNPELGTSEDESLQDRVGELARMVRDERSEMHESEAKLETLKFEIERLADEVSKSREKHQVQKAEHEARHQTLSRAIATLASEREALVTRLRRLDSKEAAIKTRLAEAERVKVDLAHESERLVRLQDLHDERLRELRIGLEGERHRLRIRQAELQRKAGELARLASARRKAIEEIITEQQSNLKAEESELKSKRSALVEAGRAELERTATELEQVLSVRLSDVEAELLTRQETLDSWIRAIYDTARPSFDRVRKADRSAAWSARPYSASGISHRMETPIKEVTDVRHLAQLESELDGLHRAVVRLDDEPERWGGFSEPSQVEGTTIPGSIASRKARWSGDSESLTARLNEKLTTLRSGIEEIGRSIGSGNGSTASTESLREPASIDLD